MFTLIALGTQYQVWWECHVVGIPIKAVDKLNFGLITVGDYRNITILKLVGLIL